MVSNMSSKMASRACTLNSSFLAVYCTRNFRNCSNVSFRYNQNENQITPSIYASHWFMTIFTNTLNFECLVRILDCFFLEGNKVIYRVILAIFKIKESGLVIRIDKRTEIVRNAMLANESRVVKRHRR